MALLILLCALAGQAAAAAGPEATVERYIRAYYSRAHEEVYDLIANRDKRFKTKEQYLRENPKYPEPVQPLMEQLASYIEITIVKTEIEGEQATVTAHLKLPHGGAPEVEKLFLDYDEEKLAALTSEKRQEIARQLAEMHQVETLPTLTGNQAFELMEEKGEWKIFLNWGGAVVVRFRGIVMGGLPWEFKPLQREVRALPGETLQAYYWARNMSTQPIIGKARHLISPQEDYFEITAPCFCFVQQTLEPGEEMTLPLQFRIPWDIPEEIKTIEVLYEFYPIEQFKEEWDPGRH
ncbi:MAG: cytochrome c oxidase assembly protein [Candidatus Methylomirabilales bacterium]